MSRENFEKKADWEHRWSAQKTGWDLGQEHPFLRDLVERARTEGRLPPEGLVYVPGCGRGHEAAFFARLGYATRGADFVPQAIDEAKIRYGTLSNLEFVVEDALVFDSRQFDLIVDRAMLCALQPANRSQYLSSMWHRLKGGGLFLGILFETVELAEGAGPPFAIKDRELWDLFHHQFDLVGLERRESQLISFIRSEWLGIWRKKD